MNNAERIDSVKLSKTAQIMNPCLHCPLFPSSGTKCFNWDSELQQPALIPNRITAQMATTNWDRGWMNDSKGTRKASTGSVWVESDLHSRPVHFFEQHTKALCSYVTDNYARAISCLRQTRVHVKVKNCQQLHSLKYVCFQPHERATLCLLRSGSFGHGVERSLRYETMDSYFLTHVLAYLQGSC